MRQIVMHLTFCKYLVFLQYNVIHGSKTKRHYIHGLMSPFKYIIDNQAENVNIFSDNLTLGIPYVDSSVENPNNLKNKFINSYKTEAISTELEECSVLGEYILKQGGNALDSAIAAAICVGTINSFSSGIGGGGFLLIRKKGKNNILDSIDFRETAPLNINIEKLSKGDNHEKGGLSVGVPAEINGLYTAHKKYGKLPWKELFKKNIQIAKEFKVKKTLEERLKKFESIILDDPGFREIYTRNGKLLKEGDTVKRENYAKTLKIIADDPESFYTGDLAKDVVDAINAQGGVFTEKDLKEYKSIFRRPLIGDFNGFKVYTSNLPTSGALIIEALNILKKYNIKELEEDEKKKGKFKHIHLLIEVFKFIMARRGELADPDFLKNPAKIVANITSKETAETVYDKLNLDGVLKESEYGQSYSNVDDHGTTHLNVVDKDEMYVLLTSTINLEFGAKFMDPKTGIIFNNQLDDFYIPNVQGAFNVKNSKINIVEPGKRPFSSTSQVILEKNNEVLVLGAAGGIRIPTSIIEVIMYLFGGHGLKSAVISNRIHNQFSPNVTYVENGVAPEIKKYLTEVGHHLEEAEENKHFTSLQALLVKKDKFGDKRIFAISDPRKGGMPSGN